MTLLATALLGFDTDDNIVAVIGGAPTAGVVDVEVEFTINNDG